MSAATGRCTRSTRPAARNAGPSRSAIPSAPGPYWTRRRARPTSPTPAARSALSTRPTAAPAGRSLGRKALPSDPAFADGTVYVAATGDTLHAVDAQSGRRRWTAEYAAPGDGAPAAPVAGDGTVFVGDREGRLHAFDTRGRPRWDFRTGGPVRSAPVLSDDTVFVGTDEGVVHAVDIATGSRRWDFTVKGPVSGLARAGTSLSFHNRTDALYSVYTPNGTQSSSYPLPSEVAVDPVVGFATVFLGHTDGTLRAVFSGGETWAFRTGGRFLSPPSATSRAVYFTTADRSTEKPTLYAVAD